MICSVCDKPINPRDGVSHTPTRTVHSKCEGRLPAPPNPDNEEYEAEGDVVVLERPRDALRALTADILAGLELLNDEPHLAARGGAHIPPAQLWERAGNIAMGLWGNFRIELPEDDTAPMAIGAKRG